jgi:hypothetical protein
MIRLGCGIRALWPRSRCFVCCDRSCLRGSNFVTATFASSHVLSTWVSVENEIGSSGAQALGNALKDNTTLTSLSLNVYRE